MGAGQLFDMVDMQLCEMATVFLYYLDGSWTVVSDGSSLDIESDEDQDSCLRWEAGQLFDMEDWTGFFLRWKLDSCFRWEFGHLFDEDTGHLFEVVVGQLFEMEDRLLFEMEAGQFV